MGTIVYLLEACRQIAYQTKLGAIGKPICSRVAAAQVPWRYHSQAASGGGQGPLPLTTLALIAKLSLCIPPEYSPAPAVAWQVFPIQLVPFRLTTVVYQPRIRLPHPHRAESAP